MEYELNGKILSKKNHACGGNEWVITRVGADVKIKCLKCGRAIFLSIDETAKIVKRYCPPEENNG